LPEAILEKNSNKQKQKGTKMKDEIPNSQIQAQIEAQRQLNTEKPKLIPPNEVQEVDLSSMDEKQKAELKVMLEAKYPDPIGLAKKLRVVIGYMDKLYPDLKKMKRRSEILDFISNAMTGQREFLSMVGLIYGIEALETEEEKIQREKREAAQKD